ncbi:OmpH family outer membrane protein [Gaopeijia maritima]|uniref:OmpH family outer membrane protein n=1 Tax=Gaopeijia maritima TaxID=3119007 RepID=UPI0032498401
MRRFALFLALALGLTIVSPVAAQTGLKVGFINSAVILDQAPGAQEAAQQFDRDLAQMRAQMQPATDSLDQLITAYEAQSLTLSPEAKQRREEEILTKREQLQQMAANLDQQATQRRAELVQPIMDRVSSVIEEIRVEGGYSIIFDVADGSIVAADPSLDLTDAVLTRLQTAG